ncbi:MAG: MotA/TolQ/ExbB proton channel family protein [Bacteroidales bacterium]|jgi:biopolymer transport protein ExbB|nr:MotA/TolQ/ExbB proton channel family protein [Bacteroidales bacterium]MCI2121577.1 MotA/TolQ/ExbB proton channel family protein [Bacteroidales bacterium]MCI2145705.1 MotA/TolQ/ExbB proton channel family protein [Bacteroidales bacterium]
MLLTILQAGAGTTASAGAPAQTQMHMSLLDMAVKGGWLMVVLLILSIIAIYIFADRLVVINRANRQQRNFMDDIEDYLRDNKVKSAKMLCRKVDSPISRMVEEGLLRIGKPYGDIQAAMQNQADIEVSRVEKGLPMLATISGGATMIGFLGTVIGMVQAFFNMANAGNNIDITLLSGGIYTAMITTVAGLIVGIPALFGYNYLTSRIDRLVYKLQNAQLDFMDILETTGMESDNKGTER